MFNGYVYKADCIVSGKSYIGITTTTFEFRKKIHILSAFNENHVNYNLHFYKAIRKYGIDNFIWNIIDTIEEEFLENLIDTLKKLEIKYVKDFNTYEKGYNGTPGGDLTFRGTPKIINMYNEDGDFLDTGTIGNLALKYNLDISAVCKVCNRIYNYTGELNNKRLVFRYIEDSFTEEDFTNIKKISKSKKKGFPIKGYYLDTGEEIFDFPSAKIAAMETGFDYRSIANCASGKYNYAGKLNKRKIIWKYI